MELDVRKKDDLTIYSLAEAVAEYMTDNSQQKPDAILLTPKQIRSLITMNVETKDSFMGIPLKFVR